VSTRIATYRAACRALYEEAVFLHSEISLLPVNSSEERNQRLRAVETAHKKLHALSLEILNVNANPRAPGWKDGPAFAPGQLTHIMAKAAARAERKWFATKKSETEENGNGKDGQQTA